MFILIPDAQMQAFVLWRIYLYFQYFFLIHGRFCFQNSYLKYKRVINMSGGQINHYYRATVPKLVLQHILMTNKKTGTQQESHKKSMNKSMNGQMFILTCVHVVEKQM